MLKDQIGLYFLRWFATTFAEDKMKNEERWTTGLKS